MSRPTKTQLLPLDLQYLRFPIYRRYITMSFSYRFLSFIALFTSVVLHFAGFEFSIVSCFAGLSIILLAYENHTLRARLDEKHNWDYIGDLERRVDRVDEGLACVRNKVSTCCKPKDACPSTVTN